MSRTIKAPWTPEQVVHLNNWQLSNRVHPFTCGKERHKGALSDILVATENGWICNHCDYTQDWAHEFMTQPLPPDPFAQFRLKQT